MQHIRTATLSFFYSLSLSPALELRDKKAQRGKHSGSWLCFALLVIYGEDPFVLLCSAGTSDAGGNSGKEWMETRQRPTASTSSSSSSSLLLHLSSLNMSAWMAEELSGASGLFFEILGSWAQYALVEHCRGAHEGVVALRRRRKKTNTAFWRDAWPLSSPQVLLRAFIFLFFLSWDEWLSARWPTFPNPCLPL